MIVVTRMFDQPDIASALQHMSPAELDQLAFGVIGFDAATMVRLYNAYESRVAGLRASSVLARPLFKVVAPCMDNYLVSLRFEEAAQARVALDATIPYVLTLRMRPTRVRLRLVADPAVDMRYVLVDRDG